MNRRRTMCAAALLTASSLAGCGVSDAPVPAPVPKVQAQPALLPSFKTLQTNQESADAVARDFVTIIESHDPQAEPFEWSSLSRVGELMDPAVLEYQLKYPEGTVYSDWNQWSQWQVTTHPAVSFTQDKRPDDMSISAQRVVRASFNLKEAGQTHIDLNTITKRARVHTITMRKNSGVWVVTNWLPGPIEDLTGAEAGGKTND